LWSYAMLIVFPPPSRGRSGGGWGLKMSRFPIPTLALPLKGREYSEAGSTAKSEGPNFMA
jgi:hypothetical protein